MSSVLFSGLLGAYQLLPPRSHERAYEGKSKINLLSVVISYFQWLPSPAAAELAASFLPRDRFRRRPLHDLQGRVKGRYLLQILESPDQDSHILGTSTIDFETENADDNKT